MAFLEKWKKKNLGEINLQKNNTACAFKGTKLSIFKIVSIYLLIFLHIYSLNLFQPYLITCLLQAPANWQIYLKGRAGVSAANSMSVGDNR